MSKLIWGCIVCPTKKGVKQLQLDPESYGIFLGRMKGSDIGICVVKQNQKTPSYYHHSFWKYLEGQN